MCSFAQVIRLIDSLFVGLLQSKELSEKLKMAPYKVESPCEGPKSLLTACLFENKTSPLACDALVADFSKCATSLN
jgi:hypothetical protein